MIRIQLAAGRLAHRHPLSGSLVTGYKGTKTFSKTESVTLAVPSQLTRLCLTPCLWPSLIVHPALSKDNPRSHRLQISNAAWYRILQSASLCLLCMRSWIRLALSDLCISSLGSEDLLWLASLSGPLILCEDSFCFWPARKRKLELPRCRQGSAWTQLREGEPSHQCLRTSFLVCTS